MRWKENSTEIKKIELGSTRIVKKFLWRKKLIDGEWRWLEFGQWEELAASRNQSWKRGQILREDCVKWIPQNWYGSPTTTAY